MGWFSKKKVDEVDPTDVDAVETSYEEPEDLIYEHHHNAMQRYWESIGSVDSDVLTYVINPMFQGAPPWPNTRQAYRLVRTDDTLIITSDGLADPFPDDPTLETRFGFGMETFIEVRGMQDATIDEVRIHWAFNAIQAMAMNTAAARGFVPQLVQHGAVSIELPTDSGPAGWVKPNGVLGALVDVQMPSRQNIVEDTPIGPVRIVPITALYPAEIDLCASGGQARLALAADLASRASGHITDPERPPLR